MLKKFFKFLDDKIWADGWTDRQKDKATLLYISFLLHTLCQECTKQGKITKLDNELR